jgi:GTPase involved in cell partitioning and DNA repair
LIEGAHEGKGLGHQFLRHVERCRLLVFLVDVSAEDPIRQLEVLREELARYSPELSTRPSLVVLNKSDVTTPSARKLKMDHDLLISAATGKHTKLLARRIGAMLLELGVEELPKARSLSSFDQPLESEDDEHPDRAQEERWGNVPEDLVDETRRLRKLR